MKVLKNILILKVVKKLGGKIMNSLLINLLAYVLDTIGTNTTTKNFIFELGEKLGEQIPKNDIEKELGELLDIFKAGMLSVNEK